MAKEEKTVVIKDPDLKPEVSELNKKLDAMAEAGMERTKCWIDFWQDSLKYFFSDQLKNKKQHKNWEWVVINYIWPSAMQELAKLSKNNPRIIANPFDDNDTESAEVWQSHLQWCWNKGLNNHGMRLEQIYAILCGKIYGYRVSKIFWESQCTWDDRQKQWIGEVKHKLWHPALFWASPMAETLEEADSCGTERWVTLGWAQKRWPDFKNELESESKKQPAPEGGFGGPNIRGSKTLAGTLGGTEGEERSLPSPQLLELILDVDKISSSTTIFGGSPDTKVVKISETYYKDYETSDAQLDEDIPAEELMATGAITEGQGNMYGQFIDNSTGQPLIKWPSRTVRKWKEPKYPTGRYVIRAGHIILNPEEEDQKYPYSRWPFVIVPHYPLPFMWQGAAATAMTMEMQDFINVTASHLLNAIKLFGDPKIAVEDGAISINPRTKKAYRIGAGPGALIRLAKGALSGGKYRIEAPPLIPNSTFALYNLFIQEYKNITGLQSIARGEQSKGKMTATEASYLTMSANDRIALQSVFEDEWIKQICLLVAEICQANYDIGRYLRIVGEDRVLGAKQITDKLKDVRFDVDVEPASTLPFDEEKKQMRYLKAYDLVNNPAPNPMLPDVLRVLEISNWKKIIQQHEVYQQFMQLQQLYEGVKSGQVQPQQALQLITDRLMQIFAKDVKQTPQGLQLIQGLQQQAGTPPIQGAKQ